MKYLNGLLCLEGSEFIRTPKTPDGLVPEGTYKSLQYNGKIKVHGRGGYGRSILIEYEALPQDYKEKVQEKFGDPYEYAAKKPFKDLILSDPKAVEYFDLYRKPDGFPLKPKSRIEYANGAAILNSLHGLLKDKRKLKRDYSISLDQFWKLAGDIVKEVSKDRPNVLPTSERRLKEIYRRYIRIGYGVLISGKVGNRNRQKVDEALEWLILSLYVKGKPYAKEVHEAYHRFITGEIEVVNVMTGEVFQREQFFRDGKPIAISDTTVWIYINKPHNRAIIDKLRTGSLEYNNTHAPHNHRHSPIYAFSKITMDDLELPFKMPDGERVKSYQIIDVASGCVVGKSFGTDKNGGLFMEAINDMFRLIANRAWGVPAEIEVEHHISSTFADGLLKGGNVFPFVRFCRPRNPQEKRAEHFIRHKKYGLQKKREGFQGRWYGRLETTRPNEDTNTLRLSFEDIVANENSDIQKWNNQLHPNQTLYPRMTRWQVLCERHNPCLIRPNIGLIARYIGHKTATSINRSQYVRVQYAKYILPHPNIIKRLKANDYNVDAYYITDNDGLINEVHLYQQDQYICTCKKLLTYNESQVEMTDTDRANMAEQCKYSQQYRSMVKEGEGKLTKLEVIEAPTNYDAIEPVTVPVSPDNGHEVPEADDIDYKFDAAYWAEKAKSDL